MASEAQTLLVAGTNYGHIYGIEYGQSVPAFQHVVSTSPNSTTEWVLASPSLSNVFYAVNNRKGASHGRVVAYRVDRINSSWSPTQISAVDSGGRGPCFLDVDNPNSPRWLLVANYRSGAAASIPIHPDGGLGAVASITDSPPGAAAFPTPSFQDQSYAHCIRVDPYTRRFALVTDAGLNQLRHYAFDHSSGQLTAIGRTNTSIWRPRHFVWHPTVPVAYVVHELSSLVSAWAFDTHTGLVKPTPLQSVPTTLPQFFFGYNMPAEVVITPNGQQLFVTNRGAESIAAYDIGVKGNSTWLTPRAFVPSGGLSPRHLTLLRQAIRHGAEESLIALVSNERTNSVAAFGVDETRLDLLLNTTNVSGVACIAIVSTHLDHPLPSPHHAKEPRRRSTPSPCTGQSSHLRPADCYSWQRFAANPIYSKWLEDKCHSASGAAGWHDDPCSCVFRSARYGESQVACEPSPAQSGGDELSLVITSIAMNGQEMPAEGGVPLALLNLSSVTHLSIASNALQGTAPAHFGDMTSLQRLGLGDNQLSGSIPSQLAQLTALTRLGLDHNRFSGTVPTEFTKLGELTLLAIDNNWQLRGFLPPLPFAQYTECCRAFNISFECPLPSGASRLCVGGALCGAYPAPSCQRE